MARKKLPLRWVIYLLLLTMMATGVSLSRYRTTIAGSASVSVARPVVEYVPGAWTGDPLAFKPGETLAYTFSVRNYDDNGRTQVTMHYDVSVNLTSPAMAAFPFTRTLYINQGGTFVPYTAAGMTFGFTGDQQHDYKIIFYWNPAENSEGYRNLQQELNVLVSAYQVN